MYSIVQEASNAGFKPTDNWTCPGCSVRIKERRNAKQHIKNCIRFTEHLHQQQINNFPCTNSDTADETVVPEYAIIEINSLGKAIENLACPKCHKYIKFRILQHQFNLTFKYCFYCPVCGYEITEQSSPLVHLPSWKRKQPDIQIRIPVSAQTVDQQVHQFLDLTFYE